ncbi:MAG TPA: zf-HC2 domain-containing protein [Myxococcaceae bacterium]|nr:zf-HC2 domain-containing protein [Myxococcaceae bacterium]
MSCSNAGELTAYLDRELPVFQLKQIESHLASCRECRSTERLLRKTVVRLAELPAFELSNATRRNVLSQVDEAANRSIGSRLKALWRPQVLFPSLGLALAVIVLVISREPLELRDARLFEVGANLELAEDYEVVGLSSLDDLEVVQHLHELEGAP